jgi:hypothetical protein
VVDEVFTVFLIADSEFGLLTGRVVPGNNHKYGFSVIPLVFVLSLLHTIASVRQILRKTHNGCRALQGTAFRMPTVIVLIENNFAYDRVGCPPARAPACPGCGHVHAMRPGAAGAAGRASRCSGLSGNTRTRPPPVRTPRRPAGCSLRDVEIVFATPVYGLNHELTQLYTKSKLAAMKLADQKLNNKTAQNALRDAWQSKDPASVRGTMERRPSANIRD